MAKLTYKIIERGEALDYDEYGRIVEFYTFKYSVPGLGTFTAKIAKSEFSFDNLHALICHQIKELGKTIGEIEVS